MLQKMESVTLQGFSGQLLDWSQHQEWLCCFPEYLSWFIFTLQTLNPKAFHVSLLVVAARKLGASLQPTCSSNLNRQWQVFSVQTYLWTPSYFPDLIFPLPRILKLT